VRAQRKITDARIPYEVPGPNELAERVDAVLSVLYLIFNEGYAAARSDELIRHALCDEAIRLTSMLQRLVENEQFHPALPEILGLLALMTLTHSRSMARTDADGALVLLEDQNRSLWDADAIARGVALVERALGMRNPGPYQIQAAIAAVHSEAATPAQTDWRQIAALYLELNRRAPSPIIMLNHAVAVAMVDGPQTGLDAIARADLEKDLSEYHHYHATRADLLRRLGDKTAAAAAYRRAIDLCENAVERRFLEGRLTGPG
jgi:RNA polymerase sigma-70 factor, ECF subfamily